MPEGNTKGHQKKTRRQRGASGKKEGNSGSGREIQGNNG